MLEYICISPLESVAQEVDVFVDLFSGDLELLFPVEHNSYSQVLHLLGAFHPGDLLYGLSSEYLRLLLVETEVPLLS